MSLLDVQSERMLAYPPVGDQLDLLWHAIDADETLKTKFSAFYNAVKAVKEEHPLP